MFRLDLILDIVNGIEKQGVQRWGANKGEYSLSRHIYVLYHQGMMKFVYDVTLV